MVMVMVGGVMEIEDRRELFLKAWGEWGTIHKACRVVDVTRGMYRRWVSEDPEFSGRVDSAKVDFGESLEDIAVARLKTPGKGTGTARLWSG